MTAIPAPESGPFQINPAPAPVVGWIVLTEHQPGTWLPDWDGKVHDDRITAGEKLTFPQVTHRIRRHRRRSG